jgi:hypothetical protein
VPAISPRREALPLACGEVGRTRSFGVPVCDFTFSTLNQMRRVRALVFRLSVYVFPVCTRDQHGRAGGRIADVPCQLHARLVLQVAIGVFITPVAGEFLAHA